MPLSYSDFRLQRIYFSLPIFMREGVAAIYSMKQHRRRFGGVFKAHLAELQANAGRTAEEYAADQLRRLRSALSYAGAHCPYYRDLFRQVGLEPDSIRSPSDLQRLPLLDKETVRSQADRLLAVPPVAGTFKHHTSGTTGAALDFVITEEANQRHYATQWFHLSWAGISRGDRWAIFGGYPVAVPGSKRPPFWVLDRFEKQLLLSVQHMTPETMPEYARVLADFQPALICCYPSAIHYMAVYLVEAGRTDIRPKGIFTWGETTLAYQREAIETAFGCRVYSSYGNGERTGDLLQCEIGNFHVVPETCVVEVLDSLGNPAAPGETGELVCTSLIERAMPLIRYRVGDTAVKADGPCSCGRTTPIVSDVAGRMNDFVLGRDGRRLGPLNNLFRSGLRIKEAQFIQQEIGSVCIRVVPRTDYCPADRARLLEEVHHKFGGQIDVTVQVVDAIPRTANGKYPFVVSKLHSASVDPSRGR